MLIAEGTMVPIRATLEISAQNIAPVNYCRGAAVSAGTKGSAAGAERSASYSGADQRPSRKVPCMRMPTSPGLAAAAVSALLLTGVLALRPCPG